MPDLGLLYKTTVCPSSFFNTEVSPAGVVWVVDFRQLVPLTFWRYLMGFNTSTTPSSNAAGFKKADAFINLSAPDENGKLVKFGFLTLYKDNGLHAAAMAHIEANPDGGVEEVLRAMVADFRSATPIANTAKFSFKKA